MPAWLVPDDTNAQMSKATERWVWQTVNSGLVLGG